MPFLCRLSRWGQGFVSVFFVCQPTQRTLAKTIYGFGFGDRDAIFFVELQETYTLALVSHM